MVLVCVAGGGGGGGCGGVTDVVVGMVTVQT